MEINKNSNKNNINNTIIKSIIFNNIVEIFIRKKNIDIKKEIISIKKAGNIFLVNIRKPIISSELYLINNEIVDLCKNKLNKLGFNIKDFEIKYR